MAAHIAFEGAVARRVFLVHVVAILGAPLFVCATVPWLHGGLRLMMALFAAALAATGWALYDENVHRIAVRRAVVGVHVTRVDPPG